MKHCVRLWKNARPIFRAFSVGMCLIRRNRRSGYPYRRVPRTWFGRWQRLLCGLMAAMLLPTSVLARDLHTAPRVDVALDVGHTLENPGVISASGTPEFVHNLALARAVRDALIAHGLRVQMIGENGQMHSLAARPKQAAGARLFVSIHHDSVQAHLLPRAREFSGFSLFVSRENPYQHSALHCASAIGAQMRAAQFLPSLYHADPILGENRPFADRDNGVHWFDRLAVARTQVLPALLFEAGVVVNPEEELRITSPQTQAVMASAIAQGIVHCLRTANDRQPRLE